MSTPRLGKFSGAVGTTTLDQSRRRSWLWPLLLFLALLGAGIWSTSTLYTALREDTGEELQTLLDANVEAMTLWLETHERAVRLMASAPPVREAAAKLIAVDEGGATVEELCRSEHLANFRARVEPVARAHDHERFSVILPSGRFLAADVDEAVGTVLPPEGQPFLERALAGETVFVPPFRSADAGGDQPACALLHPIVDDAGKTIAAFAVRMPVDTFSEILGIAQYGDTGETYAFDASGTLVSRSRFETDLRRVGLLPEDDAVTSVLNVDLRDPGCSLLDGFTPELSRQAQPLTRMAAIATTGLDGLDVVGYRDYRGVYVVGAWKWLDQYGIGIATEVDRAEAYRTLRELLLVFGVLCGLLLIATAVYFRASRRAYGLQEQVSEIQQLGQYTVESKIGAGAMGVVYRARHAMLRRPTAVKVLKPDKATEDDLARFEREVQLTSGLAHPNTIAIYDYGRSSDGTFYYAMEYLPGLSLEELVRDAGALPAARVVHILRQICGSLAEAHGVGLIHRDIKPANVMVLARGGLYDFVKVLDFGLVKETDNPDAVNVTQAGGIVGTPFYMSPETIRSPQDIDGRSDLYAVGAVGYFLLTGQRVFDGGSLGEIISLHLSATPRPPSERLGAPVPEALEAVVLGCLAKSPDDRPQTASDVIALLDAVEAAAAWTQADARAWWERHGPQLSPASP